MYPYVLLETWCFIMFNIIQTSLAQRQAHAESAGVSDERMENSSFSSHRSAACWRWKAQILASEMFPTLRLISINTIN